MAGSWKMETEKASFCFHPSGSDCTHGVPLAREVQPFEQFVGFPGYFGILHAVNAGVEPDVLPHLQVFVQGEFLAHVADVPFYLFVLPRDVESRHRARSRSGTAQAAEHAHCGGLARAVGTEESEDLPAGHIE